MPLPPRPMTPILTIPLFSVFTIPLLRRLTPRYTIIKKPSLLNMGAGERQCRLPVIDSILLKVKVISAILIDGITFFGDSIEFHNSNYNIPIKSRKKYKI
jgi:hypothetical protein